MKWWRRQSESEGPGNYLVLDEAFQSSKSKLMGKDESAGQASQVLAFNLGSCFFVDTKLLSLSLKLLFQRHFLLVAK